MKTLRRCLLLVCVAAVAGCGNWSDDDIEFLLVVPSGDELRLRAPEPGGASSSSLGAGDGYGSRRDPLGRSTVYEQQVLRNIHAVNGFVQGLTEGLDHIRSTPPSERAENLRIWGPYGDDRHRGFESRLVLEKVGEAEFSYRIEQRPRSSSEYNVVSEGRFQGKKARNGQGTIALHVGRAHQLGSSDDDELESLTLTYDMGGGRASATLEVERVDGVSATYAYEVQPNGGGTIVFDVPAVDFPGTPTRAPESLNVTARWLADRSGRADLKVFGGDLGAFEGRYAECWSSELNQVYREANFACPFGASRCHEGDAAACSIAPQ